MNATLMNQSENLDDDLRPEYDLTKLRIKAVGPGRQTNESVVKLAPDVARFFPTAEAVNEALRFLIRAAQQGNPVLREHTDTAYTADSEETEPPA